MDQEVQDALDQVYVDMGAQIAALTSRISDLEVRITNVEPAPVEEDS